MRKRTKIVCTMGPATDDEQVLAQLLEAGMDVARLNFSHGSHEEHAARIERLKRLRDALDVPLPIMLDTKGPEIRTGVFPGGAPVQLVAGCEALFVPEGHANTAEYEMSAPCTTIPQTCAHLARHVEAGDTILADDGLVAFEVLACVAEEGSSAPTAVLCRALNDASLGQRKSINVPGVDVPLPSLTEKDKADLLFGIQQEVDFVAASFVRNAIDVQAVRTFLVQNGGGHIGIIAKIENASAVRNAAEIIEVSDGIMVARGDLGVEVPAYEVPRIQKELIRACNRARKPVITATQMLDSMVRNPRPTRAEVADVANAIYDGTDCVMLSGETAIGKHPVEAVRTMAQVAVSTEAHMLGGPIPDREPVDTTLVSLAVGVAAVQTAESIGARCIVCPTMTGRTARLVASFRTAVPTYAVTPSARVRRQMQMHWGIIPLLGDVRGENRDVLRNAQEVMLELGYLEKGDIAVFTAGDRATSPADPQDPSAYAPANVMCVVQVR